MVYVLPSTLTITPANPFNTEPLTATVWIRNDNFDGYCQDLFSWTKTNIYLYMRNITSGTPWTIVKTYDCTTQCCLDGDTHQTAPDGRQGWYITFDQMNPLPIASGNTATYEFMAVDQGDQDKKPAGRIAKQTVIVSRDISDPCYTTPCGSGCPDATACGKCGNPACTGDCAAGDYVCQIIDYVKKNPLVAVAGVVVLYLLMSPSGGGRRR